MPRLIERMQDNFTPIPPVKGYKPTPRRVMEAIEEPITAPLDREPTPSIWERLKGFPREALQDMAAYEKENPLGSALSFMGNVVAGKGARGFKKAEVAGRTFLGAVDELPRFEIDDSQAVLKGLPKALQDGKLKDVLEHPELFENYPDLGDMTVRKQIDTMGNAMSGSRGSFDPTTNTISVAQGDDSLSTLLHEVQHGIQGKEGFAVGGSPKLAAEEISRLSKQGFSPDALYGIGQELRSGKRTVADTAKELDAIGWNMDKDTLYWLRDNANLDELKGISNDAMDSYKRMAGEVESRNVQGRLKMTDAERQAKPFNTTFDVPVEQQIKRMKSGTMASFSPKPIETASPKPFRPGKGWVSDAGSMPGEPTLVYKNKFAVIENLDDRGNVIYEAVDKSGNPLKQFSTLDETVDFIEGIGRQRMKSGPTNWRDLATLIEELQS